MQGPEEMMLFGPVVPRITQTTLAQCPSMTSGDAWEPAGAADGTEAGCIEGICLNLLRSLSQILIFFSAIPWS